MALAIDLALRGVETLVFEMREPNAPIYARANMTNVRSMEHFRRWGIADALRENDPVSQEINRDVAFVTRLSGDLILNMPRAYEWSEPLPFASEVAEWAPHEAIEKTLWDRVQSLPEITYCFAHEVTSFVQDNDGVTLTVETPQGVKTAADPLPRCSGWKSKSPATRHAQCADGRYCEPRPKLPLAHLCARVVNDVESIPDGLHVPLL